MTRERRHSAFHRARYVNQSLGRFFSRDPIMSLQSLYAYCNNSPMNFTDPSGMVVGNIGNSGIDPYADAPWLLDPWYWGPPCTGLGMRWLQGARNYLGLSDTSGVSVGSQKALGSAVGALGDAIGGSAGKVISAAGHSYALGIECSPFSSYCPYDVGDMITATFTMDMMMVDMLAMWGIEVDPLSGNILSIEPIGPDLSFDLTLNPGDIAHSSFDLSRLAEGCNDGIPSGSGSGNGNSKSAILRAIIGPRSGGGEATRGGGEIAL